MNYQQWREKQEKKQPESPYKMKHLIAMVGQFWVIEQQYRGGMLHEKVYKRITPYFMKNHLKLSLYHVNNILEKCLDMGWLTYEMVEHRPDVWKKCFYVTQSGIDAVIASKDAGHYVKSVEWIIDEAKKKQERELKRKVDIDYSPFKF